MELVCHEFSSICESCTSCSLSISTCTCIVLLILTILITLLLQEFINSLWKGLCLTNSLAIGRQANGFLIGIIYDIFGGMFSFHCLIFCFYKNQFHLSVIVRVLYSTFLTCTFATTLVIPASLFFADSSIFSSKS